MLIKSDHKQWYDGCQSYDDDRDTIFIRKTSTLTHLMVPKDFPYITHKYEGWNDYRTSSFIIYFAGTYYPGFWTDKYEDNKIKSYVNYDIENIKKDYIDYWYGKSGLYEYFSQPRKFLTDLSISYGPIFGIFANSLNNKDPQPRVDLIINPNLETFGLHKILTAPIAYNQLKLWLMNQARPEKPIPVMPNDIKIEQAGFHLKTSFRKKK